MALSTDFSRRITGGSAGTRLFLTAGAIPFVGSLLSLDSNGYAHPLVAGEPFAGISTNRILAVDWSSSPANGDLLVQAVTGRFFFLGTISGATLADAVTQRKVYASDDTTLTYTALGNTYIGDVCNVMANGDVLIAASTPEQRDATPGSEGVIQYADAAATINVRDINKVIQAPITAARTYTLPAVAQCIGQYFTIQTGGAFALTVAGNGSEKVAGAASVATAAAVGSTITVLGTGIAGAEWAVVGKN